MISADDLNIVLLAAGVDDFAGDVTSLGGGEVNNTYLLSCHKRKLILRVARDEESQTLPDEARALQLLDLPRVPELVFFDPEHRINNRLWILETYISGVTVDRLSRAQFTSLGNLMAQVHKTSGSEARLSLWQQLLDSSKNFGDEQFILNHPDPTLHKLITAAHAEYEELESVYSVVKPVLIHSDATPSNILVDGDDVGLIDWEFSKFSDPMLDFATIYYDDIEYNQSKWRIKITPDEKLALFEGYLQGGGVVDEARLAFWMRFDKLTAAIFLYWRLHGSKRATSDTERDQYQLDFNNLTRSLCNSPFS